MLLLLWGCGTSDDAGRPYMGNVMVSQDGVASIENVDNTQSWATQLRRLPGVFVNGQGENLTVRIRAQTSSFTLDSSPLFVLDGVPMGNNFSAIASAISINDVSSITVLKNASEIGEWGLRGSNGVIVVKSKKP
jgi:outer membrane receptor protein involved in Fe transport